MTPAKRSAEAGLFSRLGPRLMLTFALALLPLAVLNYVQTRQYERESDARAEAALLGATVTVANRQVDRIMQARGAATALAAVVGQIGPDSPLCDEAMRGVIDDSDGHFAFAGFVRPDGFVPCASLDRQINLAGGEKLRALVADPRPVITVNPRGPVAGESVLIFSHPVYGGAGTLAGFVTLSSPHRAIAPVDAESQAGGPDPLAFITFDDAGTMLTASNGLEAAPALLPQGRDLAALRESAGRSFAAISQSGRQQIYAIVPLAEDRLYVLAVWPSIESANGLMRPGVPSFAFPVLMWAASLLVALVAAEHQVLRHIRALRENIIRFADGSRALPRLDFSQASAELRDVGDAYARMAESVIHDEAELEDMVHQKEVLLREVHHRVKNNLQLIASIINMQIRKAESPEAKLLMRGLQDRVMSLATIHRELYQTSGVTDIRADELLSRIVRQVVKLGSRPGLPFEVVTRFDDIRLTPDQSVPLSLLLTESLANAMKYSTAPAGELPALTVALRRSGEGEAVIEVVNSADETRAAPPGADQRTGLGDQLIRAFVQQLGGTLERAHAGGFYRLTVRFPVTPLSHGEERASA